MLFYATWSRGFRPGGVNRRGSFPPYEADYLTNYEAGARSASAAGSHFNVAVYLEDWKDIQLSFLGHNGLTEVRNAGNARIRAFEADLFLRPMQGLTWSTGVSYNHADLRRTSVSTKRPSTAASPAFGGLDLVRRKGRQACRSPPIGRATAASATNGTSERRRSANVQGVVTYEGKRTRDLRPGINDIYGNLDAYTQVDLSAGIEKGPWTVDLFVKNLFDVRGQLSKSIQCREEVCGDPVGVTAIGGKIYTTCHPPPHDRPARRPQILEDALQPAMLPRAA